MISQVPLLECKTRVGISDYCIEAILLNNTFTTHDMDLQDASLMTIIFLCRTDNYYMYLPVGKVTQVPFTTTKMRAQSMGESHLK